MQLALDLGMTLTEINQRMSSSEFSLWSALHQSQPRGVARDDFHHARTATLLANINASKGKSYSVSDFMYEDQETKLERGNKAFMARLASLSTKGK